MTRLRVFIILMCAVPAVGCKRKPATPPPNLWDIDTIRTISYKLDVSGRDDHGAPAQTTAELALAFQGRGKVKVTLAGADLGGFSMTGQGALTADKAGVDTPIYLELLSLLPDKPSDLGIAGAHWVTKFPPDRELGGMQSKVVYQSTIDSEVTAVGPTTTTKLAGKAGFISNAGWKKALDDQFGPSPSVDTMIYTSALSSENGYLAGALDFDTAKGNVSRVTVDYVRFPRVNMTADQIRNSPDHETMTFTQH